MTAKALKDELHRQPFVPLRMYLTDGKSYDIRHPEMVFVTQWEVYVGIVTEPEDDPAEEVPARTKLVSLSHVVRVEPIDQAPAATSHAS